MIPPRRPRPALNGRTWVEAPEAVPESERLAATPADVAVAPQAPSTETAPIRAEPTTVDTGIGPLPADLWTLIGEPVPKRASAPEMVAGQTRTALQTQAHRGPSARQEVGARQPAVPAQPDRRASPAAPRVAGAGVSPTIQRVAALPTQQQRPTGAARPTTEAATAQSETGEAEAESESGIDIEALARKVYSEVRRRLRSEWERSRNR
jgi:hypothetical protein